MAKDKDDGRTTVVMKATISGSRDGEAWPARGETLECSAAEAADLVAQGLAAFPGAKVEQATAPGAPEAAVEKRGG